MDTNKLKKFAQEARSQLIAQVAAKLKLVMAEGSAASREAPGAVRELAGEIRVTSEQQVVEKVAYTWFNRFTALRFMDANGYTIPRVVTPAEGQTRPEILSDAAAGQYDDATSEPVRQAVAGLLDGRTPSRDAQGEAYSQLLVAACNHWHKHMPFMFEKVKDYTELLMPEDLLSQESILSRLRAVMTDEDCQDVEIIGWLYQFYISEKKDQVFAGLKKNQKITAENIPAATQLFTPHWIVRYLVENSLGRLWLLNRPGSKLAAQMDYYIAPEEPETDFLKIGKPEEIKICDPACGSGHMLTYAFDLLYAIYEEDGYDPTAIPALILKHNLTGIEIDDRAGGLAAFALTMKAAAKLGRRRFLRVEVKPDIVVLQNVAFMPAELTDVAAVVGKDLFRDELRATVTQFEQAKNFGSLIEPKLRDTAETLRVVEARDFTSDLLLKEVQARVVAVLRMAEALSSKYHVVVTNPPYIGRNSMNLKLKNWVEGHFPAGKHDVMTAFMTRASRLSREAGCWGMINTPSWMFLSSFEDLRSELLSKGFITSLNHNGRGIFGSDFGSVAFVVRNRIPTTKENGVYRRLFEKHVDVRSSLQIRDIYLDKKYNRFEISQIDFQRIPGAPIAYWLSDKAKQAFEDGVLLGDVANVGKGLDTGDNDRFLRYWHETPQSGDRWIPCQKGGAYRKWYGNNDWVIDWKENGAELKASEKSNLRNVQNYFKPGYSWTMISSGPTAFRYFPEGHVFESTGPCLFAKEDRLPNFGAFLNSRVTTEYLKLLAPMLHVQSGHVSRLPVFPEILENEQIRFSGVSLRQLGQSDWDAYESSANFTSLPLLSPDHRAETLEATYASVRAYWQGMTGEMQRLEEQNNRIFIHAYGLADELTPEVPIEEITLTCNPAYRYGVKGSAEEREARLKTDTVAEFLSFAVGCMFGRYSLDVPGLILADQGQTFADYLAALQAKGPAESSFLPDVDNVIPVLDGDWFPDDIVDRFRKFLRVTFGEEHFRENLAFIEAQIGDIRKYFTRAFYEDHLKRYKKRPIYWMFSSPKGTFQALVYMHRYRPDTVSVLLNDYLREFIRKLEAERARLEKLSDDPSASQSQKTKALKDVITVRKEIDELTEWERDVVFPLAQAKIEIDLDDGVKCNYPKFGGALKPIKGLEASDDE